MVRSIGNMVLGALLVMPRICLAASGEPYAIVIKDHKFNPPRLIVPAGKKIKLTIENQDPTAEEFESYQLNREEVVDPGQKIAVYLGPLKPGVYGYFGEKNPKTAQGVIAAQ